MPARPRVQRWLCSTRRLGWGCAGRGLTVDREPAFPGDAESDRARDAVRLAGLSHPRIVAEQLTDRRYGSDSGGYRAPGSTPYRGIEEERGL